MKKNKQKKYEIYRFSGKEMLSCILSGAGLLLLIGYIFYNNLWISLLAVPMLPIFVKYWKKSRKRKLLFDLNMQFKEGLTALSGSLHTGYVIENAFLEACQEVEALYGKDCFMAKEFSYMLHQMKVNMTAEEVLEDFGKRSGLEDARNFADIFSIAKRSSGGLAGIMESTAEVIGEKIETQREIETLIQAKRFEQKLMNIVPALMILYMRAANAEFMEVLYETWMGRVIMTVCLIVYAAAFLIAEKIVDIKV